MGLKVAIAGGSGYAGGELLRLVGAHPDLELVSVTAHGNAGRTVADLHPNLVSLGDVVFGDSTVAALEGADVVFMALPHGASAPLAAALPPDVRVVDLGSDHRLSDAGAHAQYYGGDHSEPWVYGLPELPGQRAAIAAASRVANTGCHAVAAILSAAPLISAGVARPEDVVITSMSGTSGAGRAVLGHLLASEVMGDLSAYKVGAHRHVPEIRQATGITSLTMTPVLAPMPRGILSTITLHPAKPVTTDAVRAVLVDAYAEEAFVHVLSGDRQPHTAATAGSNCALLQCVVDMDSGRIVVTCAIDNLGKGAAGQAVQNANIMLGLAETAGLTTDGVAP